MAQFDPINPFVSPNDSTLDYYGSGDINNDNVIDMGDVYRLDSIIRGYLLDIQDDRVYDRSDINGDQELSDQDFRLLEEYVAGISFYLPSHWNSLKTREERISWLEKMISIDKTNEQTSPANYSGDYYSDQVIINFHGYNEQALRFFDESTIDVDQNGRFNLPVFYGAIGYNRPDLNLSRQMVAIIVGDNVFDWNDWCLIDPQWDQLVFIADTTEPDVNQHFPPLNNWMDGIRNITKRDTISPLIGIIPPGDILNSNSGFIDLEYSLVDENLKNAWYYLDEEPVMHIIYDDSMYLDVENDKLVNVYEESGSIQLMLRNGSYDLIIEAEDLFSNYTQERLQINVMDPSPRITIHSPVMDSTYVENYPNLHFTIEESDFARAWYSLDSGLTKNEIDKEGSLILQLDNGLHQLIVHAEDIFQNWSSDTLVFTVSRNIDIVGLNCNGDSWVSIYPNPTGDRVNIILNDVPEEIIDIRIHELTGRLIWSYLPSRHKQLSSRIIVDLSNQPSGVYLLKASMANHRQLVSKFIKM